MKVNNADLITSAVKESQYPEASIPEIAFVGRSNVGKSSLINKLLNRKSLARTSGQPGKTQTLNFYNIEGKLVFVDVPGYGYAKVSKTQREQFGQMIEEYLSTRDVLKGVVSLMDSRHQPTEDDVLMYQWLNYYKIPILVVGTKVDKIPKSQINKVESQIKKTIQFDRANSDLILFSSQTGVGFDELWQWIEDKTEN
ncbi:MAG: ribosome biogenesis GTP-binding protein YihA/YsxC [Lactobacillaceae bacterium]|jgi:GTP-binding protein|nr:ribosome biogenesis GTP-binding protein YihA/YsxC [Lactobacillaceae bacterium]